MLESRFHALSLGQGQAPFATRMLKEGIHEVLYIMFQCLIVTLSCLNQCQQQVLFVSRCVVKFYILESSCTIIFLTTF